VICYLAKGDVALSITLTLCSTLLAVVAMPTLTWWYLGERIPVPVWGMLFTVLKIVIAIVLIIAIIVAVNHNRMAEVSLVIMAAVVLHNMIGLVSGYGFTKLLGYNQKTCRTVAIEVGKQNSGLSVALAIKYFTPLAALPGGLFSIWHNITGSLLASWWV